MKIKSERCRQSKLSNVTFVKSESDIIYLESRRTFSGNFREINKLYLRT